MFTLRGHFCDMDTFKYSFLTLATTKIMGLIATVDCWMFDNRIFLSMDLIANLHIFFLKFHSNNNLTALLENHNLSSIL